MDGTKAGGEIQELKDVTLKGVVILNEKLGRGAYGSVFTVKYEGRVCAAKKIHTILTDEDVGAAERQAIKNDFIRECLCCSSIHHPNIVQFLGVFFDPSDDSGLPIMVMERMKASLKIFVENNKSTIAFEKKISILHDVSLGLRFLHKHKPPILHRDLSPNNVMLTSQLVAKIGDLGVAKVVRADSWQTRYKLRLTRAVPGTQDFMPPEAMNVDSLYGTPIDVFSFGGIALYVFGEKWPAPGPLKQKSPTGIVTLTEVERRQQYLDKMTDKAAEVRQLVEQCLDDDPDKRPTIQKVSTDIESFNCKNETVRISVQSEIARDILMPGPDEGGTAAAAATIRVLELHKDIGRQLEEKLFVLQIGQQMRFRLGPTLMSHDIHMMCNYCKATQSFQHEIYHKLDWTCNRGDQYDPDRYADILIEKAGILHFKYFAMDDNDDSLTGSGYIVVEPRFEYSLDKICCITHNTKLLGPLTEWKKRLKVSYEAAYNMIHFTPIQQLGNSKSAYAISDQLSICDLYLSTPKPQDETATYKKKLQDLMHEPAFIQVKQLVDDMSKEWNMTCITDVIWNYTSFDSQWLPQHPDAAYNLINSPHLRPAYALDVTLKQFSDEIVDGKWVCKGINATVTSERDKDVIASCLMNDVLPAAKLWEYFCVNIDTIVSEFRQKVNSSSKSAGGPSNKLDIIQDPEYCRYGSKINIDMAMQLFNVPLNKDVSQEETEHYCNALRQYLEHLNISKKQMIIEQLQKATDNLVATVHYEFLDPKGPQRQYITKEQPLFSRYFYVLNDGNDLTTEEIEGKGGCNVVAHDGWVKNADPLVNFAAPGSLVYFQRELNQWNGTVKLYYDDNCGDDSDDKSFLWDHMITYTQINAWLFHGFWLDNCLNTPIHIYKKLLTAARQVKPDLFVVAKLSTDCKKTENYFVNHLGINCFIKEAGHATTSHNLSDLVYQYSGTAVGSFFEPNPSPFRDSFARAMLVDATYNNDYCHIQSRNIWNVLPNAALVSIAGCAVGSFHGYDELVPHAISITEESRLYTVYSPDASKNCVHLNSGILRARAELNQLHQKLAEEGYTQISTYLLTDDDVVVVERHCPTSHKSYYLIAHTSFCSPPPKNFPTKSNRKQNHCYIPTMYVPGVIDEIILEAKLVRDDAPTDEFIKPAHEISSLHCYHLDMQRHVPHTKSEMCQVIPSSRNTQEVEFNGFTVGSILILSVHVGETAEGFRQLRGFIGRPLPTTDFKGELSPYQRGKLYRRDLADACHSLSLSDLNYFLYQCENEGNDVYYIENYGPLTYCGLQGIVSVLETVRSSNNLDHPLCQHLRKGIWYINYISTKLGSLNKLPNTINEILSILTRLPRYLIPCYFDAVISVIYQELVFHAHRCMGKFVRNGSSIVHSLALGHVQLFGHCADVNVPKLLDDDPRLYDSDRTSSLAAGLPHFSTGYLRCWGRDTFISLRGLMLVTGQTKYARNCLLIYGKCIRHGLIPNLLDGGVSARYNARDAVWWWLLCIKEYVTMVDNGEKILKVSVDCMYPKDDSFPDKDVDNHKKVQDLIQEVLQKHYDEIKFRERRAGPALDNHMNTDGFNVTAGISKDTGFVYGGNSNNCGTWMNKIGESSLAGNLHVSATPRDGSAIELVGLCYAVVHWLSNQYSNGVYPHCGVLKADGKQYFTYADWADMIKENFEKNFYIPLELDAIENAHFIHKRSFIHKKGIYKDSVGASYDYPDYQLRPNFTIAMTVAPDLFDENHAWEALRIAETKLLGPVGMATLDPDDWKYNGYYDQSNDSSDYNTAKGFNFHQGPEWVWLVGYFLRAKLIFAQRLQRDDYIKEAIAVCNKMQASHAAILRESPWKGLPQMTNKDGSPCQNSCPVHACAMGTMLDALYELDQCIRKLNQKKSSC